MKLTFGIILILVGSLLGFIQLQGQMKWGFIKQNPILMSLMGIPISLLFIYSTRILNEYFGANWPGRLIGQAIGIIVFTILSYVLFGEALTYKTVVCILLAFTIVLIQVI